MFDVFWLRLEKVFVSAAAKVGVQPPARDQDAMVEEILDIVRRLDRDRSIFDLAVEAADRSQANRAMIPFYVHEVDSPPDSARLIASHLRNKEQHRRKSAPSGEEG